MSAETYLLLQKYWWLIVSLLASLLVFLMFVQGGQTLLYTIAKNEKERTLLVNTLGRKWEFTFTTLVTFGGAFFAAFPLFYSTSFGGAYWVWMAILFAFIIQAVSYEFRTKPNNFLGQKTYEKFLFVNGVLGTTLIGVAVGTFFNGANFIMDKANLVQIENPIISYWANSWHGLEAVLNFHNVLLGLTVLFLSRVLGLLYFIHTIDHNAIVERTKKHLIYNAIPFVVFFLSFVVWLMLKSGFAVDPVSKLVSLEPFKYFHNFIEMPFVGILFLAGVLLVLWGIASSLYTKTSKGFWFSAAGTVLTVFSLFLIAGMNNTVYYPSLVELQYSLTIENSSSSPYTLKAMAFVSLMVPFVIAYIWHAWKSINNKKIDDNEMSNESHVY